MSIEDEIQAIAEQPPYHVTIDTPAYGSLLSVDCEGFILLRKNKDGSFTSLKREVSDYEALGVLRWAARCIDKDMDTFTSLGDPLPDQDD